MDRSTRWLIRGLAAANIGLIAFVALTWKGRPDGAGAPPPSPSSALAWLESLAVKQGADADFLLVDADKRTETPPEWVETAAAEAQAQARARRVLEAARGIEVAPLTGPIDVGRDHEVIGSAVGAAASSFLFFASGAIIPVLPWIFGLSGTPAVVVALVLVGIALLVTGGMVGLLSGGPPLRRGLRQLAIGFGAAAVTYLLGLLFGVVAG